MSDITFYHAPGACSGVTMTALEEVGLDFTDTPINIRQSQQKSAEYLKVNPMGKVPALKVGDRVFTENAAILYFLHGQYPSAQLLPVEDIDTGPSQGLQDVIWCSASLHPVTRQVFMPIRFTTDSLESGAGNVRADGIAKYQPILALIAERVADGKWWYGERWSIIDTYLRWNYATAEKGGLDLSPFPALADHANRVMDRPSFKRAQAREQAALEAFGLG